MHLNLTIDNVFVENTYDQKIFCVSFSVELVSEISKSEIKSFKKLFFWAER